MKPELKFYLHNARVDYAWIHGHRCPRCRVMVTPGSWAAKKDLTPCCLKRVEILSHWMFYNWTRIHRYHMDHYRRALAEWEELERRRQEREEARARVAKLEEDERRKRRRQRELGHPIVDPDQAHPTEPSFRQAPAHQYLTDRPKPDWWPPGGIDLVAAPTEITEGYHLTDEGQRHLTELLLCEPDQPMYDDPHVGSYYRAINDAVLGPVKRANRSKRDHGRAHRHRS